MSIQTINHRRRDGVLSPPSPIPSRPSGAGGLSHNRSSASGSSMPGPTPPAGADERPFIADDPGLALTQTDSHGIYLLCFLLVAVPTFVAFFLYALEVFRHGR